MIKRLLGINVSNRFLHWVFDSILIQLLFVKQCNSDGCIEIRGTRFRRIDEREFVKRFEYDNFRERFEERSRRPFPKMIWATLMNLIIVR